MLRNWDRLFPNYKSPGASLLRNFRRHKFPSLYILKQPGLPCPGKRRRESCLRCKKLQQPSLQLTCSLGFHAQATDVVRAASAANLGSHAYARLRCSEASDGTSF